MGSKAFQIVLILVLYSFTAFAQQDSTQSPLDSVKIPKIQLKQIVLDLNELYFNRMILKEQDSKIKLYESIMSDQDKRFSASQNLVDSKNSEITLLKNTMPGFWTYAAYIGGGIVLGIAAHSLIGAK